MPSVEKKQRLTGWARGHPGAIKELGSVPARKLRFGGFIVNVGQAHRLPFGLATGAVALQTPENQLLAWSRCSSFTAP